MSTTLGFARRRYREPDTFGRGVWCGVLLTFCLFSCALWW